jgi:hypothetical protein
MNSMLARDSAQRLLERCPRPPQFEPANDPMRLLHELVDDGDLRAAEFDLEEANEHAEEVENECVDAKAQAANREERLDALCEDLLGAVDGAAEARDEGKVAAALDTLIDRVSELAAQATQ